MAYVEFADVVMKLRGLVPELNGVPVYVDSPLCDLYGPCFLPEVGAAKVRRMREQLEPLLPDLNDKQRQVIDEMIAIISSAGFGIHLPRTLNDMLADPGQTLILREILSSAGLGPTDKVLAEFIVLHELGHYLDWLAADNKPTWEQEVHLGQVNLYMGKYGDDLVRAYRNQPAERRADAYALATLKRLHAPRSGGLLGIVQDVLSRLMQGGDK